MKDLIINGFEKGIASSYNSGFQDMRLINTDIEGSIYIGKENYNLPQPSYSGQATFASGTDIMTCSNLTDAVTGACVTFSNTGGALPSPLVAGTRYWLIKISGATFKLATTWQYANAGTPVVDLTTDGTGTTIATVATFLNATTLSYDSSGKFILDTVNNAIWFGTGETFQLVVKGSYGLNGGVIWKNYFLYSDSNTVKALGPISSPTTWAVTSVVNMAANDYARQMIVGQDGIMYFIGSFSQLGSILETPGETFAPGTPATFTANASALDLPSNIYLNCLGELGRYLLIGTTSGVYYWDRVSASFEYPLLVGENITNIISSNNLAYIYSSTSNKYFVTNLTLVEELFSLPESLFKEGSSGGGEYYPAGGTIECNSSIIKNNKLYFALTASSANASGIWEYDLLKKVLKINSPIASGLYSATNPVIQLKCLTPGYLTYSESGIGKIDQLNYRIASDYKAYLITPIYRVGLPLRKKRLSKAKIILDKALTSGQAIRVSVRTTWKGSWTVVSTFSYTTHGSKESLEFSLRKIEAQLIQFKIELESGAGIGTTPYLKEIRFS